MTQPATKYDPQHTENKWYAYWLKHKLFESAPDERIPFSVVIPPPNITGVLHMGHMLNNTILDVLVRRAKMQGKNTCWVPGTDHASIATEAKVVAKLAAQGLKKSDLSREEFLEHAWEWKEKHGGIILEQLKKLGASCDWNRTRFTMNPEYSESVTRVFVDLFRKGYLYRGVRMVNWDPAARTALSDEEVVYKETTGKLYYLRYRIEGEEKQYVVIATTRPETILGDTAVCVHPEDNRYAFLKGRKVIVPLINRAVPVIMDEYVDREFGTGVLKVTPAHDVNDYMLGEKYGLEVMDIFNDNGTLNEKAGLYIGMDRFEVRKQIEKDLELASSLEKTEPYTNKVGFSERTDAVIEPKLSMQWFVKMSELAKPALKAILQDDIKLYPAKYKNTYRHWMENIKDWCISRQLWWGHRIPAWYLPQGGYVVAESPEEALKLAKEKSENPSLSLTDLRQDEDSLDTWFSSWLWPISVFDTRIPGNVSEKPNRDLSYYYPTEVLVTAPDILFFWVARMIMAGYEWMGEMPFRNIYLHGLVRDKLGRKMSKSLGNSPDPISLMDQYGADGVRMGMLLSAPTGNDILFDEALCEQGRNFNNKIWNSFRLIQGQKIDETIPQPESSAAACRWFESLLNKTTAELDDLFEKYRLSEALMLVYKLFRDEFSSWYLEIIKPGFQQPMDAKTYTTTLEFFDHLFRLLHPFMPFISEELWHNLSPRKEGESILISLWPEPSEIDPSILFEFEQTKSIISSVRAFRQEKNIATKDSLRLLFKGNAPYPEILAKMCNLSEIIPIENKPAGCYGFMVDTSEFFVPLEGMINLGEEINRIASELDYFRGFLVSVNKKLENERFVKNAPAEVVEIERKKQSDALSKIRALEEQMKELSRG